jgi:hypothetical protein
LRFPVVSAEEEHAVPNSSIHHSTVNQDISAVKGDLKIPWLNAPDSQIPPLADTNSRSLSPAEMKVLGINSKLEGFLQSQGDKARRRRSHLPGERRRSSSSSHPGVHDPISNEQVDLTYDLKPPRKGGKGAGWNTMLTIESLPEEAIYDSDDVER